MTMGEAVPGHLAARQVEARDGVRPSRSAPSTARYDITYTDYKEAGVTVRVR